MKCYTDSNRGCIIVHSLLAILQSIPSGCRDSIIRCLQHTFFSFGATTTAQYCLGYLNTIMEHDKASNIASQLHSSALNGDWKRFKKTMKVLSK